MVQILTNLLPDANPEETLLDFEVAAHKRFLYGVSKYINFRLLFSSWTEHSKEGVRYVGLKHRFENDKEFTMMVRSLSALAFLPPNQVGNVFNQLSDAFPGENDQDYIRKRGHLGQVRPTRYSAVTWNHTHHWIVYQKLQIV